MGKPWQSRPAGLVQALDPQRVQCAVVLKLDAKGHRTATHFAVLDVLLGARADLNARLEALAAIRAVAGHKLLGGNACALRRRLENGLQSIQVVDVLRIEAGDPASQGFDLRILATGHGRSFYTAAESHAGPNSNEVAAVNAAPPGQRILACALVCAIVSGCGGAGRLSADAPSGVDLAGTWRLNRGLSNDPEQLYEKFRRQRAMHNEELPPPSAPPGRPHAPGGGGAAATDSRADPNNPQSAESQAAANRSHLNPYDIGVFGTIPRGDLITIRQRPDEMYIFDGLVDRSFTPGTQSVVSVPEGVADQHSGWKSKAYVIDVKAQAGPETIERYHLSEDGKQLVAEIQSNGGNMPSMRIKRVYDRVGDKPNSAPSND